MAIVHIGNQYVINKRCCISKAVFVKIKKLEEQLRRLEGGKEKKVVAPKKPVTKTKTAPKKNAQASAKKTATKTARKTSAKK
jgi:hypothetical protein